MADQNGIGQPSIHLNIIDAYVQPTYFFQFMIDAKFVNQKYDLSDLGNFRSLFGHLSLYHRRANLFQYRDQ